MQPAQLVPEHFAAYGPQAREVAVRNLGILRQLPLSFAPLLLAEVIAYDSKFPAERHEVDAQFAFMDALSLERRREAMARFAALRLSADLEAVDWVRNPRDFSERLSAHLWTTNQLAEFRAAAVVFLEAVRAAVPPPEPAVPRLSVVVLGQGATNLSSPLFRRLRPHGTHFARVNAAQGGLRAVLQRVAVRASEHPVPFGHWYIDGGMPDERPAAVETVAYGELESIRQAVVGKLRSLKAAGTGTEAQRSALMQVKPEDVGLDGTGPQGVLNHFKVALLSEGSGVQFFSTTFVQWASREVLRRAQPVTLVARYAPRMTEQSMNAALAGDRTPPKLDAEGALVDAEMGAYYTWMNQMRLPGGERSAFLAWIEDGSEALVIGPSIARGAESTQPVNLIQLMDMALEG